MRRSLGRSPARTVPTAFAVIALAAAVGCSSERRSANAFPLTTSSTTAAMVTTTKPRPQSTTTAAPKATAAAPASVALNEPYSFAPNQVAPPLPLPTDAADTAAFKLIAYHDWLYSHNPDTALMRNAYIEYSSYWDPVLSDLTSLAKNHRRLYDIGSVYRITKSELVGSNHRLFIANPIVESRLVNSDGAVYEIWRKPKGSAFVATIVLHSGTWKIADLGPYGDHPVLKERP